MSNTYTLQNPALNPKRVFILQKSEVEKRWDPFFYSANLFGFLKTTKFKVLSIREISEYTISGFGVGKEDQDLTETGFTNNLNVVFSGKYPVKQLREIITGNLIKGSLPKQDEKEGECSVVQINSINNDGTISLDDLLTAKPIFSNSQRLIKNDVLVVITGATIGKIAFWNYEGEYFLGGDIIKFQTNEIADNIFVFNFLRSGLMQTEIKRNITGATNGHLAPSDVANLPIPVPPLSKQKEIAEHITNIRNQAQALKDQTKDLLQKASEEIEEILLN